MEEELTRFLLTIEMGQRLAWVGDWKKFNVTAMKVIQKAQFWDGETVLVKVFSFRAFDRGHFEVELGMHKDIAGSVMDANLQRSIVENVFYLVEKRLQNVSVGWNKSSLRH